MAQGFAGQLTNTGDAYSARSMVLEHSSTPFGVVMVSDKDGICRLPDKANVLGVGASTGKAVGIVVKQDGDGIPCNEALKTPVGAGETVYAKVGQAVTLIRVGAIFVQTETAVNAGDQVYFRIKGSLLGAIRNDDDAGNAVKLNGAVFMQGANAGEIVEVDLNLNTVQESY